MMDREAYNKIFDNGLRHIECAKLLGQNRAYGFAISHLILGIEELIKYQLVMAKSGDDDSFDNVIDPKKGKSVFRDHLTKHSLLREFHESIGDDFSSKFHELIFLKVTGQDVTHVPKKLMIIVSRNGVLFLPLGVRT
jgi:AbiV family abortive infection protein